MVREGLARHIRGSLIEAVEVLDPRSVRRDAEGPSAFAASLTGRRMAEAARRGKYLWLLVGAPELDDAAVLAHPESLMPVVIHLGMSGQILLTSAEAPAEKHLKIRMSLRTAAGERLQLRFADQRIFGGMFRDELEPVLESGVARPGAGRSELALPVVPTSVSHIARDPLDPEFDDAAFAARLRRTARGIKRVLLDQSMISGVGNIYADEALWRARLHYAKPAASLRATQVKELLAAVREVMAAALAQGGTSFDALYVNVNGESGYFERDLNVYGRAGKPCRRCEQNGGGGVVVREPLMNRSSYRCPKCQQAPRGFRGG